MREIALLFENPAGHDMSVFTNLDQTCTIFYMNGHNTEATRLMELNLSSRGRGFIPEVEREIGRLLGYDVWKIQAYLMHIGAPKPLYSTEMASQAMPSTALEFLVDSYKDAV